MTNRKIRKFLALLDAGLVEAWKDNAGEVRIYKVHKARAGIRGLLLD